MSVEASIDTSLAEGRHPAAAAQPHGRITCDALVASGSLKRGTRHVHCLGATLPPPASSTAAPLCRPQRKLAMTCRSRSWVAVVGSTIGAFLAILKHSVSLAVLTALIIPGGYRAGLDDGGWITTSYLIAEIIVIPLKRVVREHLLAAHLFIDQHSLVFKG